MVGNILFLWAARTCFLAEDVAFTDGGASAGMGVEVRLYNSQIRD
jgi:hypothetical protein